MTDFELAKDKVLMGAERRSMVMSTDERATPPITNPAMRWWRRCKTGADPLHKVTIIPRGMALGVTQQLPLDDRYTYSRAVPDDPAGGALRRSGGRGDGLRRKTTGAGNDIEKATELARKMVCEWGMSDELGPMTFGRREEQVFLGRDLAHNKDYSEHTAVEIDREVRRLIDLSYSTAKVILTENVTSAARAWPSACSNRKSLTARKLPRWSVRFRRAVRCPLTRPPVHSGTPRVVPRWRGEAQDRRGRDARFRADHAQAVARLNARHRLLRQVSGPPPLAGEALFIAGERHPLHAARARSANALRPMSTTNSQISAIAPAQRRPRDTLSRRDGHTQRHAGLVLRWRPVSRSRIALSITRSRWKPPVRRSSTSAANRLAPARAPYLSRSNWIACCR